MRLFFNFPENKLPLFVDSIGYGWNQHSVNRPQGYPYYHWLQSDKGSGKFNIDGVQIELKKGQGILIAANIPHTYSPVTDQWITSYFTFGGVLVQEIVAALGFHKMLIVQRPNTAITGFTRQSYITLANQVDQISLSGSALVYEFLLMLQPFMITEVDNPNTKKVTTAILTLIHEQYQNNLTNEDFSTVCNYSIQYILRTFHNTYKITPRQYLITYRIQKAKELLITQPDISLVEIADKVGFSTENYLIHVFKYHEGMTPGQFRKMFG